MADENVETPWLENDHVALGARETELRGGEEYRDLMAAQRLMLNRLSGSALPADVAREVTAHLEAVTELVSGYQVREHDRVDGWRPDLPGRGNALFPPYVIDKQEPCRLRGRVTFTRFFLGGNGAAHGGALPLLFDDALGRVMNLGVPGIARTAFLKVNYRRITPIDVELTFEVSRDSIDGRKRWGSGRLIGPNGELLSDAECLFLALLPGQG
ncbi:MAG: PaaI family thioesterase [Jatrophihabitans sp.]